MLNILDSVGRAALLRAHANDESFPLDGSNWARLVWTRFLIAHRIQCDKTNLLSRLHSKEGALGHIRYMARRGMQYWFLHDAETYGLPWNFRGEATAGECMRRTLEQMQLGPRDLRQMEADWMQEQRERPASYAVDGSGFWIDADSELMASGSRQRRITQRNSVARICTSKDSSLSS